ncbi:MULTISPECIES: hypothetical protein [Methylobacterium]|uniref:Growth inhibitor PemK n=1 Tax=Methylobacterium thuringiense TaxID=1003091 RepID=A0ABQ4TJP2_9HYPH|nr:MULTISPECIES: hypothetical protein [Methylobacterium]TXN25031.1 hypothetical protein FV217_00345 [Methylobacterium sp. WL9]GJE54752.1 hypothetical protein EKPJFOCH_1234 [Methylobacterium thuringiense]
MTLPRPEPGLVIRYAYPWLSEHRAGCEEGVKDRPCAIVLTVADEADVTRCLVVPVTHSAPSTSTEALELPPEAKRHLGLDSERSWVILSECNDFVWPGPDLRRAGTQCDASIAYGFLPPRFFAELRRRFVALARERRNLRVIRTD